MNAMHAVFPADREPTLVCSWANATAAPEWIQLDPEGTRTLEDGAGKETYNPRIEWLNSLHPTDKIFAPLGGVGDAMLVGAADRGVTSIHRITYQDLAQFPHKGEVVVPGKIGSGGEKQRERAEKVASMVELVKGGNVGIFRPYTERDARIGVIRVYIGALLAMQDETRKRAQQRATRLERDQAYFIDRSTSHQPVLDLRAKLVETHQPIDAMLGHEKELEREIIRQLKQLKVWTEVLEPVKGMGPRIAARMIGTIIDISRFDTWQGLCKYSGWHTIPKPGDPARRMSAKFVRGESAQFHDLLRMAMWLFGQQINRNNSQFRWYSDYYKSVHQAEVGQPVNGHVMTKGWLQSRANRYAVSKFNKYLWHGWRELEGLQVPYKFPASNWLDPEKFSGKAIAKNDTKEEELLSQTD